MKKSIFVGDIKKELNQLGREQMKEKLLQDILADMNVCRFEGWDVFEYTKQIIKLLEGLLTLKKSK